MATDRSYWTVWKEDGTVIWINDEHSLKALSPNEVTEEGIDTCANRKHPLKVEPSIIDIGEIRANFWRLANVPNFKNFVLSLSEERIRFFNENSAYMF